MLSTSDITKDEIKDIIDKKESAPIKVITASDIKAVFMDFQYTPPGIPSVEIISACPQSSNEWSNFTSDTIEAVQVTISSIPQHSFLNLAVDGVSVESIDVMYAICQLLDRKESHTGAVYNKHNAKNDRYQIIGGYCITTIGTLVVDTDILRQSGVSADLIKIKDFASDKLVEDLCSYKTLNMLYDDVSNGATEGLFEDAGALSCTIFFMKLHLHSVNGLTVPAKHRALYPWTFKNIRPKHKEYVRNSFRDQVTLWSYIHPSKCCETNHKCP